METYRHTQFGYLILALSLGAGVALAVTAYTSEQLWYVVMLLLLLITLFFFYALTVQVRAGSLEFWFGGGIIKKQIPLKEIVRAQIVRNPWYYGWGIHLTPHGWLYNIAGLQAIEIELCSGKEFRLGTDEPEQLLAALKVL